MPDIFLGLERPSSAIDRGHSLRSLYLPPAALPSLPPTFLRVTFKCLVGDGPLDVPQNGSYRKRGVVGAAPYIFTQSLNNASSQRFSVIPREQRDRGNPHLMWGIATSPAAPRNDTLFFGGDCHGCWRTLAMTDLWEETGFACISAGGMIK